MSFFRKRRNVILTLLVIVLCAVLLVVTSRDRTQVSAIEGATRDIFAPVNSFFSSVGRTISSWGGFFLSFGKVKHENEDLKDQIEELKALCVNLYEYKNENDRLTQLLKLKESTPKRTEAARIILRDVSNWIGTFMIDKGSDDGVKTGMAVVVPSGVVGRILSVSKDTAIVVQIVDPRNSTGAFISRTRDPLIVEGTGKDNMTLSGRPFSSDVSFEVGDVVMTSGVGGIYPKGYVIGDVIEVTHGDLGVDSALVIKPRVDFQRLEEVLVLLDAQEAKDAGSLLNNEPLLAQ